MTAPAHPVRGPLGVGERVLLVDPKQRRYLVTLVAGAHFHTHSGILAHDAVLGRPEGSTVAASTGRRFLVLRPTLGDVVLKMPRGAQVIYPKDLGAILLAADIGPGMRVLEAGVGSGALSMALLRAGAEVIGYEVRPDFAAGARANVAAWAGPDPRYRVEERDVYAGIDEEELDRVVLDLPEPWRALGPVARALRPGGIVLAYVPSVTQVAALRAGLGRGPFGMAETFEVLRRTWHVEERSVRPDHRMVAHTGFLTTARRLVEEPGEGADGGGAGAPDGPGPGGTGP
ncbi:MAG TPA: tRNA (adenine-N1)-methyltransferase [Acidimicrobiales bacterium]|nr:tRNA (adenine-N1)-methyltransferase [Acidimicrobiales bacterium]